MLDQMRSAAKSWVSKLLLGLLGLSFLVWGVPSSFLPQIGKTDLFTSGSSSISPTDYAFALRDTLLRLGFEQIPPASELRQSGLTDVLLAQLQRDVLLDEEARLMQLGADEDAALQILLRDKAFRDEFTGAFSRAIFTNFLANGRFSQAEYIERLRAEAKRDQLLTTVGTGVTAPDIFYQATLLYERESRAIDYVRIDPDRFDEIVPPPDEELRVWFEGRREEFRAPEYRTFTYMPLDAERLATPEAISDEQVQAAYEAGKARLGTPETRTFEQLRFDNRELADSAYAKLQAGLSFEELVQEQGQKLEDIRFGPLERSELPSMTASEIFALPQGEVSPVINDLAGPVLVRINDTTPAHVPSIEEISETLRHDLALMQAANSLRQTEREIEDARSEGATLAELAAQYNLPIATLTLNDIGHPQPGSDDSLPDTLAPALRNTLLAQVFSSQPGIDRDPLLGQNSYVWYQLEEIIPARNLEFDEVVDDGIRPSWISTEENRLLQEKTEQLKTELENGKSLEQIAQENGLIVNRAAGLQRVANTPFEHGIGKDVIDAVFATPTSDPAKSIDFIYPKDERQTVILFQVTDTAEPTSTDPQSLGEQRKRIISAQLTQDLTNQFLQQAQRDHAVMQNQDLLEALLSDNGRVDLR